jgi:uncharacterized Zn finger protein (UPF0148 family)
MTNQICESCGAELIPGKEFCPKCQLRIAGVPAGEDAAGENLYPKDTPENRTKEMKEFKVIGMKEVWSLDSGGNFNKKRWKICSIRTGQMVGA